MKDPEPTPASVAQDVVNKLASGIESAGNALGEVAPRIWEMTVRQQVVTGWQLVTLSVVGMVVALLVLRMSHAISDTFDRGITRVVMMLMLLAAFALGTDGVKRIVNPEYYAAVAIMRAVK